MWNDFNKYGGDTTTSAIIRSWLTAWTNWRYRGAAPLSELKGREGGEKVFSAFCVWKSHKKSSYCQNRMTGICSGFETIKPPMPSVDIWVTGDTKPQRIVGKIATNTRDVMELSNNAENLTIKPTNTYFIILWPSESHFRNCFQTETWSIRSIRDIEKMHKQAACGQSVSGWCSSVSLSWLPAVPLLTSLCTSEASHDNMAKPTTQPAWPLPSQQQTLSTRRHSNVWEKVGESKCHRCCLCSQYESN